jgi:hypothetical protein
MLLETIKYGKGTYLTNVFIADINMQAYTIVYLHSCAVCNVHDDMELGPVADYVRCRYR